MQEGGTSLLSCVGYGELDVSISWRFDGRAVVNSSLVVIYEEDVVSGGTTFKESSLLLCSVDRSSVGSYTCIVSNGISNTSFTVQLTVQFVNGKNYCFN